MLAKGRGAKVEKDTKIKGDDRIEAEVNLKWKRISHKKFGEIHSLEKSKT